MHSLYLFAVWLHILAAAIWVGGMFFLVLVVMPSLRRGERAAGAAFLGQTGARFRNVGWASFAILLATGAFSLWVRGVRVVWFAQRAWLATPFARAVLLKLALFALVLVVSAVHDFSLGPRATRAVQADPRSPTAERLRSGASWLGRANALLALLLVAVGVILVRGWPF